MLGNHEDSIVPPIVIVLLPLFSNSAWNYEHSESFRYEFARVVRPSARRRRMSEKNTPEKGGTCDAGIPDITGVPMILYKQ